MSELLSQALSIEENINETKSTRIKSNEIFVFVESGKPIHLSKQSREKTNLTHI